MLSVKRRTDSCVNADLITVLCCPETRQRLRWATAAELLRAKVEQGLAREDGNVVYPVVEGIPMLMVEHAVRLED